MQFVRHGPDIPECLLQGHEDGRVVFFCGAGISYPARPPGFAGLVEKVYTALAATPDAEQKAAIKAGPFDTAIGLLETDIVGGRETVRRALAGILTPDLSAPNPTFVVVEFACGLRTPTSRRSEGLATLADRPIHSWYCAHPHPISAARRAPAGR